MRLVAQTKLIDPVVPLAHLVKIWLLNRCHMGTSIRVLDR